MFRFRPQPAASPLCTLLPRYILLHARRYSVKAPPNPDDVNYPLLNRLYNEYLEYAVGPERNVYKLKAFSQAMKAIASKSSRIQSLEDVAELPGIGTGIRRRIEEYLLSEAEGGSNDITSKKSANQKEMLEACKVFQRISGIGPKKARVLAEQGFRSLDDLLNDKKTFERLPKAIQTGLRYNSKIDQRIQRDQIDTLSTRIIKALPEFEVYVTGSYRRGAPSSSDIDILLFHPSMVEARLRSVKAPTKAQSEKAMKESALLKSAVPALVKAKILGEPLTVGPAKWQGLANLQGTEGRLGRIDLNLMPLQSRGAALVGHTGDADFNQYLRNKALKMLMRLNDYGLWKRPELWRMNEKTDTKDDDEWELVPTETEKDVFDALGEGWVEPEKRNFANIAPKRRK